MSTQTFTPEVRAFLLEATRTGKFATVRPDGRPHVVPIWFLLDGDTIVFTTGEGSIKAKNMRRDPHVSLCVDDEHPLYSFATIEGTVTFSDSPQELTIWATRIASRYMGEHLAEQYGKRNSGPGELLVRITPTKILFLKDVAGY
jgi:PPOX class probable F420-dependent enzyme